MNILIDRLPETVIIGGTRCPINSDFRTSILFELLIQDDEREESEKLTRALEIYYPRLPARLTKECLIEAYEKIVWFYSCGKNPEKKKRWKSKSDERGEENTDEEENEEDAPEENHGENVYSFEHDASYIYAAFMEQYGIDLTEADMHWWKFRALFESLNEKTRFRQIMGFRSMEITEKMTKEQKAYYRRMKKVYALPLPQAEVDRQNAIIDALMNGGDLTGLI